MHTVSAYVFALIPLLILAVWPGARAESGRRGMNHLCPRGIELDKALAEAYRAWWVESRKPNPKPHHRLVAKNNAKNALVTHLNCCAACKRVMEETA